MIVLEVSIKDNVRGVDNDLIELIGLHSLLEVENFIKVHLGIDLILLDLIVDDVILNICCFQVKFEAANLAFLSGLHIYVAPSLQRAG